MNKKETENIAQTYINIHGTNVYGDELSENEHH